MPVRSDHRPAPHVAAAGATIDTTDRAAVTAAYTDLYQPAVAVQAPAASPEDVAACDRSNALYSVNDGGPGEHDLDRDDDGIACERQ
ncbi:hypothetical protein [uncultured Friedmanniella sp.]|uniref:hypothetical protein n=1 Tax=uncultured Friedmanniella sp. TaxID=335381 RepID=UPI0035CA47E0